MALLWQYSIQDELLQPTSKAELYGRKVMHGGITMVLIIFLEKRLVAMDMQSTLFFSLRVWGRQIPSLLIFPIFFKCWQIVNWISWDQVLILEYFCANWIPPILLKYLDQRYDEFPCLSSRLNDISSEWKFENQFQTWLSIMTPWP